MLTNPFMDVLLTLAGVTTDDESENRAYELTLR